MIGLSLSAQTEIFATDSLVIDSVESGLGVGDSLGSYGGWTGSGSAGNPNDTGYKMVYWIHGLAGGVESWQGVVHATRDQGVRKLPNYKERKAFSVNLDYNDSETSDIFNAATDYGNKLDQHVKSSNFSHLSRQEAFVIAHSQGGIMARALRRAYFNTDPLIHVPELFKGLVTFGSPHKGAMVINNSSNGRAQKWINKGCRVMSRAEITEFTDSIFLLDLIISPDVINDFATSACDGLTTNVLPILVSSIRKEIAKHYKVGAPELIVLDSIAANDNIEVVNFYGVEKEPVLWRTLNSMTYEVDSAKFGAFLPDSPFYLDSDDQMPRKVNNRINDFIAKKNEHLTAEKNELNLAEMVSGPVAFVLLGFRYPGKEPRQKAEFYDSAAHWLATANTTWKRIIGARRDSTFIDGYYCDCYSQSGPKGTYQFSRTRILNPGNCPSSLDSICSVSTVIGHVIIEEENDGVVTKSSQTGYPGVYKTVRMAETNHMQERNSSETRTGLSDLFEGRHGPNFIISRK